MAKVDYVRPVEALHGKIVKTDVTGFAKRSLEGTKYTFTREKKYEYNPTARQQAVTAQFTWTINEMKRIRANQSELAAKQALWKQQSTYLTFNGFLFHYCWINYTPETEDED